MNAWSSKRTILTDDDGASALILAIMLVVFVGLAMIVVDVGAVYAERRKLQTAADAAALAGVQELPAFGPDDTYATAAKAQAQDYAAKNAAAGVIIEPVVEKTDPGSTYYDRIRVTVRNANTQLFVKPLFDYLRNTARQSTALVAAMGVATISSPSSYSRGVMPFGVMSMDGTSATSPFGYSFGDTVLLKQGAGDGSQGNFHFLSLTDPPGDSSGWSVLKDSIEAGGDPDQVYINELYKTKTGVNGRNVSRALGVLVGSDTCTFTVVATFDPATGEATINDWTCPRLIVCPIIIDPGPPIRYNWGALNGTSNPVKIIGFAYFFLEAYGDSGTECWVSGRFIRPVGSDDPVQWGGFDPYGAIKFRLSE